MSTFNDLVKLFSSTQNPAEMKNLLEGILTPKEKLELVQRLDIVKMLKKKVPQHRIAEKLGVGVATVTRGSKEIQRGKFENI